MSFETDLTALCNPVFNGRVWFDAIPAGKSAAELADPFLVIQQAGGTDKWYVDNTLPDFQNARMQMSVWGARRTEVSDALRVLRKAIADSNTAELISIPLGAAVNDYNEVLDLRGSRQDFGFWYLDPLAAIP